MQRATPAKRLPSTLRALPPPEGGPPPTPIPARSKVLSEARHSPVGQGCFSVWHPGQREKVGSAITQQSPVAVPFLSNPHFRPTHPHRLNHVLASPLAHGRSFLDPPKPNSNLETSGCVADRVSRFLVRKFEKYEPPLLPAEFLQLNPGGRAKRLPTVRAASNNRHERSPEPSHRDPNHKRFPLSHAHDPSSSISKRPPTRLRPPSSVARI